MLPAFAAAGLVATFTVGPSIPAVAELSRGAIHRVPDLAVHLGHEPPAPSFLDAAVPAGRAIGPPPCLGDVCQPRVAVPGYEPGYGRVHRSELFVLALERAQVEPLASIAWAFVATGVRVDYTPVMLDGPNAVGHGWGSVFLRLRLRVDADNVPVFPHRPR